MSKNEPGQEVVPASRDAVLSQFTQMFGTVPDAEDDDGSGILLRILEAETWEDVNTEGTMPNSDKMVGVRQRINSIAKRQSDLDEGLPYYLVVDAVNADTGEVLRWQTSSDTITAQLIKLHLMGALPVLATVKLSDKPTKKGFRPAGLVVHASSGAGRGTIEG